MHDPVNRVLGNTSARQAIHRSSETDRIRTHLRYVASKLQHDNVHAVTAAQRQRRQQLMKVLLSYAEKGQFPQRQRDGLGARRPRFIDHRGVHCAVGHLIEHTDGVRITEQVNTRHEFDYIEDIDRELLSGWARENGLSLMECAMIQPQYLEPEDLCPYLFLARNNSLTPLTGKVRQFRDEQLKPHATGRWLAHHYYTCGPALVQFMKDHPWSQSPARHTLLWIAQRL